ncbi:gluconate 2-dehydrogenase gamma chain [Albimonas donghaensis]|uniref:Gluconate 2-dehydrogenase gamma chain n=1 Tax=Albimonas donghaensis TaxID=356660 RepID=A0A1H3DS52_9RHOB|nr:gluconate 2-dehydrogenase gamma chain [Albimonas donghaensis]
MTCRSHDTRRGGDPRPGLRPSRRSVITLAAAAAATAWAGRASAETHRGGVPWSPSADDAPFHGTREAHFLTDAEFAVVDAMCARILPGDENDPGAREAGAAVFIDRQLASPWGRGELWYMQGPFSEGLPTQGYQADFTPAALYRAAIAAVEGHCATAFDGRGFADLAEDEQDQVLTAMDEETLTFDHVPAKSFFDMMRENTIEGFFCDPIYGGNADMVGWRLVGFPGARYDYRPWLDHGGRRLDLPPVGIAGRPAWRRAGTPAPRR